LRAHSGAIAFAPPNLTNRRSDESTLAHGSHTSHDMTALRRLGACVVATSSVFNGGAAASSAHSVVPPRFFFNATTAAENDAIALRVEQAPSLREREIRLYLVPAGLAATMRSRFDSRLSFIGSVRSSRRARLVFTVPPLTPGSYALAFWCRGCLPRGQGLGLQASPKLRITAPIGEGCSTTRPNGHRPFGALPAWSGWNYHGNGKLFALLRSDGRLVTNPLGGYKMRWSANKGVSGQFTVRYWMLDPLSAPLAARTGTLNGSDSMMSQMRFEPRCWQISGRVGDVSLSFVAQVVLGSS